MSESCAAQQVRIGLSELRRWAWLLDSEVVEVGTDDDDNTDQGVPILLIAGPLSSTC